MASEEVTKDAQEGQGAVDGEFLMLRLDRLLEEYLRTLDAYQQAQQQLTKQLSSGFMSLAQANFSNNTRMRYGQDYYDERMQASRKIAIKEEEHKCSFTIASGISNPPDHATAESSLAKEEPSGSEVTEEHAKEESSESKNTEENPKEEPDTKTAPNEEPQKSDSENTSKPVDPIRWFGVLVPPALRSAQTSFVTAVEGPILELSTLEKDMRQQEIEIGRARKQLKKCYAAFPDARIR